MSIIRSIGREVMIAAGMHRKRLAEKLGQSGNRITVLLHRVLSASEMPDLSPPGMVMSIESFSLLLDQLQKQFHVIGPDRFFNGWPGPLDRPSVLITFDDGWYDVVQSALPEMKRRGIGGICFVTPRVIEEGSLFWPERLIHFSRVLAREEFQREAGVLPPASLDADGIESLMTFWKSLSEDERKIRLAALSSAADNEPAGKRVADWNDLKLLQDAGIEIGSHGHTHRLLTTLSEEECREELALSRAAISEKLGKAPRAIAYPNGDRNQAVRRLAGEAGYEFGFSLTGHPDDPYDIPRVNLHEGSISSPARLIWSMART